jgi:NTP pyrophosphatase (non-canonical NTP hydrolase)
MNKREHIFTVLQEECAEVIQCVSKIKRFGLTNTQPASGMLNLQILVNELNDLMAVVEMLEEDGLPKIRDDVKIQNKKQKVKHFLNVSKQAGTLNDK